MSKKLIIVGGGIGGMAAALALLRAGFEVTVFERAPAFTEAGAGMSLWPNATRVLQSLGVLEAVAARGEPVTQFNLQRPDGKTISAISMTGFPTPALCIHRADLHRALRHPLPAGFLQANQRLQAFAQEPEGITARFAGGLEAGADGLIGADGINSVVRSQIHGAGEPILSRLLHLAGHRAGNGGGGSRAYQRNMGFGAPIRHFAHGARTGLLVRHPQWSAFAIGCSGRTQIRSPGFVQKLA